MPIDNNARTWKRESEYFLTIKDDLMNIILLTNDLVLLANFEEKLLRTLH